jgi:predicted peptidase
MACHPRKPFFLIAFISLAALSCSRLAIGTGLPNGVPDDLGCLPEDSGGVETAVLRGTTASPYGYKVYLPAGCEYSACPFPLLIYLHGSGSGENASVGPESIKNFWGGPLEDIARGSVKPRYPLIVAAPQYTDADGTWVPEHLRLFIAYLKQAYNVNEKRVYLTGFSMGGYGTFSYLGSESGDDIAAAVPIAGAGWGGQAARMARVPIWVFYGKLDSYQNAISLVASINEAHPRVRAKATIFTELGHTGVYEVFSGPGLAAVDPEYAPFVMNIFDWMFQYEKP